MDNLKELSRRSERARRAAAAYEARAAERDEWIREISNDHTLAVLAEAAGVSVGRVSHIVGYRGKKAGRPRKSNA